MAEADVNARVGSNGNTPLHLAVQVIINTPFHPEIIKLLLGNGADRSLQNTEEQTATGFKHFFNVICISFCNYICSVVNYFFKL